MRSWVKIVILDTNDYRDWTNNSCMLKLCQNVPQGVKKVPYKYRPYTKQRSRLDQIRSLTENTAQVLFGTRFWNAEFDGDTHF